MNAQFTKTFMRAAIVVLVATLSSPKAYKSYPNTKEVSPC